MLRRWGWANLMLQADAAIASRGVRAEEGFLIEARAFGGLVCPQAVVLASGRSSCDTWQCCLLNQTAGLGVPATPAVSR
jgi:hypothetical protein